MLTPRHSTALLLLTVTFLALVSGCTSFSTIPPDVNDPPGTTPTPPALSTLRGIIDFNGIEHYTPPATVHIGTRRIVTDNGQFTVTGLETGTYDIRITADHFHTYEGQVIINSESALLNVAMDLGFSPYEMEVFARLVWAEAIGEPEEGRIAVAASVLNRLAHPEYPNTLTEVIFQTVKVNGITYYQYSPVQDNRIWDLQLSREDHRREYDIAMKAVYAAIAGQDPSLGATGFFNPDKAPNALGKDRPPTVKIGNHQFHL